MPVIAANDIKRRGVAPIAEILDTSPEAVISVRGKEKFVVMDLDHYHYLRQCELEAALMEARADLEAGRIEGASVAEHIADLGNE